MKLFFILPQLIIVCLAFFTPKSHAFQPDFLRVQMVEKALPFYNRPYPKSPRTLVELNGVVVYRPNHGLTHGVRKAAISEDLIEVLISNAGTGEFKKWLASQTAKDPSFHLKLNLACLMSRTGRVDESSIVTTAERTTSANNFKTVAHEVGIQFNPGEESAIAQAIILDGAKSDNINLNHLSHFLRVAHLMDLVRLGWDTRPAMSELIPELTQTNFKKLYNRERAYLKATGVHRNKTYDPIFFELSLHPSELLNAVRTVRNLP